MPLLVPGKGAVRRCLRYRRTRSRKGQGLDEAQSRANRKLWARSDLVGAYANRDLRPVEMLLLARYHVALSGRVLELGCGAGRLTSALSEVATAAYGLDISPSMIAFCRQRYPTASFVEGDIRNMADLVPGRFAAIVGSYNILDVLGDAERGAAFDQIHGMLGPDGVLIMSSHNRASARPRRVWEEVTAQGLSMLQVGRALVAMPRWIMNRRRLVAFEHEEPGYAIRNDVSHDFAALHYYVSRDAQERRLGEHGFTLLECLDLDGRLVARGDAASHCSELHYVARRSGGVEG